MAAAVNRYNALRRERGDLCRIGTGFAAAATLLALVAGMAAAQTPAEPTKPAADDAPAAAPAPPPPPTDNAGVVGVFGTLMQQGVTSMTTGIDAMVGAAKGAADAASKGAADVAKDAADVAKGAADVAVDSVIKLPVAGIAAGREQCGIAGNGAPDCQVAAAALCRASGFRTGTSVDFETAENCPASYRGSSRERPDGACPLEHFVTRALCQ
jgi:hypothetical protein